MRDTAARRFTAVAVGPGLLSVGLSAALLALTLSPGEADGAGRQESPALSQSARSTAPPPAIPVPDPQPVVSAPTSDRTTDVADFSESTVTCSGDVCWDWQVGNYPDENGDPAGESTYDDQGCDPETTDCD